MVVFEKKRPLYISFILFIYVLYSLYICTTTCPLLVHRLSTACPVVVPLVVLDLVMLFVCLSK